MAERSNVFGKLLREALGIDPGIVRSITVTAEPLDVLKVTVQLIPRLSALDSAREAAQRMMESKNVTVYLNWERPLFDVTSVADASTRLEV